VNFYDAAIVIDEAKVAEFVHKIAHARTCCADHISERLLTELSNNRLWLTFLAEVR
jgi:hypothetical protein